MCSPPVDSSSADPRTGGRLTGRWWPRTSATRPCPGRSPMLLSVERLSARYDAVAALERVDLRVDRGEMVALLGRNGAGKTTLLRCIAGLHRPSSGRVLFEGEDLG